MKFNWVTLHVRDLEQSLAFYNGLLGIPVDSRFGGGDTEIAMLGEPNRPKLELLCRQGEAVERPGNGVSVGYEVENLQEVIERIKNGSTSVITGPISPSPNMTFYYVTDPDGYKLQLF